MGAGVGEVDEGHGAVLREGGGFGLWWEGWRVGEVRNYGRWVVSGGS